MNNNYTIYTDNISDIGVIIDNMSRHLNIIDVVERDPDKLSHGNFKTNDIVLIRNKNNFLRHCPGTRNYICCGYYVLKTTYNCDINCSYCTLQEYFGFKHKTHFYNYGDLFNELDTVFSDKNNSIHRVGTGEFTDSNFIDYYTGLNYQLVDFFSHYPDNIIEFKSKLTDIKPLIDYSHSKNIIFSWSLNTHFVKNKYEIKAHSISDRIAIAKYAQEKGFNVGLHFDPIILYNNCETEYLEILNMIKNSLDPNKIIWISLGMLRYTSVLEDYFIRKNLKEFVYN